MRFLFLKISNVHVSVFDSKLLVNRYLKYTCHTFKFPVFVFLYSENSVSTNKEEV